MATDKDAAVPSGGIGFCGVFFIVLFVLKILGKVAWSWWWITAPLWGPLAIIAVVFCATMLVILLVGGIVHLVQNIKDAF